MKTLFYYFPMNSMIGKVLFLFLVFFYSSLVSIYMLYLAIRYGPSKFSKIKKDRSKPKVLDDRRFGEHKFFQTKKHIKIHYVSGGRSDRQMMLFLHGFPENWYSWRHQIDEFSKDYHTVAINLRGYGESSKPKDVSEYSTDKLTDDVYQLIQHLLQRSSSSSSNKIILVAHDWGGAIAWILAKLHPDLIEKFVVINAPSPYVHGYRMANDWNQFFSSWYMFFFNMPILPEKMFLFNDFAIYEQIFKKFSRSKDDLDAYKYYLQSWNDISAPLNFYRAAFRGYGGKVPVQISNTMVEPPTLIIWGENDTALVKELATDSIKICRQAKVRFIPDCSHWTQIERPQETNQFMREFLK